MNTDIDDFKAKEFVESNMNPDKTVFVAMNKRKLNEGQLIEIFQYIEEHCPSINTISLRGCEIEVLPPVLFSNKEFSKKILNLNLSENKIKKIPANFFQDLEKLTFLNLSGNGITSLHENTFVSNTNLKVLNLDGNRITALDPSTFVSNTMLRDLDLKNNQIKVIAENTFESLRNLERLNISKNRVFLLNK